MATSHWESPRSPGNAGLRITRITLPLLLATATLTPPANAQIDSFFGPSRSRPPCPTRLNLWAQNQLDKRREALEAEARANATRSYRNPMSNLMDWLEVLSARQKAGQFRRSLEEALRRNHGCQASLR